MSFFSQIIFDNFNFKNKLQIKLTIELNYSQDNFESRFVLNIVTYNVVNYAIS